MCCLAASSSFTVQDDYSGAAHSSNNPGHRASYIHDAWNLMEKAIAILEVHAKWPQQSCGGLRCVGLLEAALNALRIKTTTSILNRETPS